MQVAPKREALLAAQGELAETMKQLAEAQAKLKAVEEKMEVLQAQYLEAMAKKEGLAKQVCVCMCVCMRVHKGGWCATACAFVCMRVHKGGLRVRLCMRVCEHVCTKGGCMCDCA